MATKQHYVLICAWGNTCDIVAKSAQSALAFLDRVDGRNFLEKLHCSFRV